jgi:hypothetical protein
MPGDEHITIIAPNKFLITLALSLLASSRQ